MQVSGRQVAKAPPRYSKGFADGPRISDSTELTCGLSRPNESVLYRARETSPVISTRPMHRIATDTPTSSRSHAMISHSCATLDKTPSVSSGRKTHTHTMQSEIKEGREKLQQCKSERGWIGGIGYHGERETKTNVHGREEHTRWVGDYADGTAIVSERGAVRRWLLAYRRQIFLPPRIPRDALSRSQTALGTVPGSKGGGWEDGDGGAGEIQRKSMSSCHLAPLCAVLREAVLAWSERIAPCSRSALISPPSNPEKIDAFVFARAFSHGTL